MQILKNTAYYCTVFILVFVFSNCVAYAVFLVKQKKQSYHLTITDQHVLTAYNHYTSSELSQLLKETWLPGWIYEPWLGFREHPRVGKFVNVTPDGRRLIPDTPVTEKTLFFFGGSTTFGYGVADSETIPALLQAKLGDQYQVSNYGRGYYFSKQENILLDLLDEQGKIPDVAIFLDGLNEGCELGEYQNEMSTLFQVAQSHYSQSARFYFMNLPIFAFANTIKDKLSAKTSKKSSHHFRSDYCYENRVSLVDLLNKRLAAREAFCKAHHIDCLTFLQPIAGVHGPYLSQDLSDDKKAMLARHFQNIQPVFVGKAHRYDISHSLDTMHQHAYVDDVHYSALASEKISQAIYDTLKSSHLTH